MNILSENDKVLSRVNNLSINVPRKPELKTGRTNLFRNFGHVDNINNQSLK